MEAGGGNKEKAGTHASPPLLIKVWPDAGLARSGSSKAHEIQFSAVMEYTPEKYTVTVSLALNGTQVTTSSPITDQPGEVGLFLNR